MENVCSLPSHSLDKIGPATTTPLPIVVVVTKHEGGGRGRKRELKMGSNGPDITYWCPIIQISNLGSSTKSGAHYRLWGL